MERVLPGLHESFCENYSWVALAVFDSIRDNQPQELAALLAKYPREAKRLLHEEQEFLPMESAIRQSRPDIVDVLLNSGINIERTDNEGYTALIRAANVQEWGIVNRLLQAGADVTSKTRQNLTALHFAAAHKNHQVARSLLSRGAPVDCIDHENRTPLAMAIENCDSGMVELLLEYDASLDFSGDSSGYLLKAVIASTPEVTLQLFKAGIDPDGVFFTPKHKSTPLVHLVGMSTFGDDPNSGGYQEWEARIWKLTQLMLNCGADPNLPSSEGLTPLDAAVSTGRLDIIPLLVEHGARQVSVDSPECLNGEVFGQRSVTPRSKAVALVRSLDPVMSMQVGCRLCIRKLILNGCAQRESLISNVPKLPLPPRLQSYLCDVGGVGF